MACSADLRTRALIARSAVARPAYINCTQRGGLLKLLRLNPGPEIGAWGHGRLYPRPGNSVLGRLLLQTEATVYGRPSSKPLHLVEWTVFFFFIHITLACAVKKENRKCMVLYIRMERTQCNGVSGVRMYPDCIFHPFSQLKPLTTTSSPFWLPPTRPAEKLVSGRGGHNFHSHFTIGRGIA